MGESQSTIELSNHLSALIPPLRPYQSIELFAGAGGKTGIARRIAWDEACLTLTCSPAQKQTERCHPDETRPFQVREYARIQTFPDTWVFEGSMTQQYKQIGNAVPVNLAFALGTSLVQILNEIERLENARTRKYQEFCFSRTKSDFFQFT